MRLPPENVLLQVVLLALLGRVGRFHVRQQLLYGGQSESGQGQTRLARHIVHTNSVTASNIHVQYTVPVSLMLDAAGALALQRHDLRQLGLVRHVHLLHLLRRNTDSESEVKVKVKVK